jgi:hypothetical protein
MCELFTNIYQGCLPSKPPGCQGCRCEISLSREVKVLGKENMDSYSKLVYKWLNSMVYGRYNELDNYGSWDL